MLLEGVARTHVGCRRKINEDAFLSRPELGLWAVADGMGGHQAGEVASALVVESLASLAGISGGPLHPGAVCTALQEANARLVAMAGSSPEPRTIGSTIVALLIDGASFSCLWAGDSRAYLIRDSTIRQLTRDHSLVQQLVESGDLDAASAARHPNANIITRAVGASPDLIVDQTEGDVRDGDVFLLASDGLTRLADDNELLKEFGSSDLNGACDRLLDACLQRGAPDNVTFIVLRARG